MRVDRRTALWVTGAVAFILGGVLLALERPMWDAGGPGIVGFELAGSAGAARDILVEWGSSGRDAARLSLWLDFAFLVAYGTFVTLAAAALGRRAAVVAAPLAAACDAVENVALLLVLGGRGGATAPVVAAVFAALKFVLIGFALGSIAVALVARRPAWGLAALAAGVVVVAASVVVADRQTVPARSDGGRVLALPAGDVHVRVDGPAGAPALLLLHGFSVSGRWWDRVVPRLARRYRVVRVDLLGHGGSEKPRDGYTMERQADVVAGAARRLGVRRAAVVAHSMGGTVATALVERHRALVGRLMLVGTAPAPYDGGPTIATGAFLPVSGHLTRLYVSDDLLRWVAEQGLRPEVDASPAQMAALDAVTYRSFTGSARAAEDFKRAAPLDARLRRARFPVTAVFGSGDGEAADAARYLRVARSRLLRIPGSGHSPMLDRPARMAAVVEAFASGGG
jgi:pimeloyl-ACP methyl ester carboxylesterase